MQIRIDRSYRAHGRQRPNLGTLARQHGQTSTPGTTENNSLRASDSRQSGPMLLSEILLCILGKRSKKRVIPKLGGTAQHNSYIQHIPTQHLRRPRKSQVTEDRDPMLQLSLGNLSLSWACWARGAPDATLMHARDHILCSAASAGT